MSVSDWVILVHRFARLNSVVAGGFTRTEGAKKLRERILAMGVQITPDKAARVYDEALRTQPA